MRKRDPIKQAKQWKAYYKRNKKRLALKQKLYRQSERGRLKFVMWSRQYRVELKLETLRAYCKTKKLKCACCKESNTKFLTLDHINGDGAKQRKQDKHRAGNSYAWLKQHGFPNKKKFQVLCYNCNCARAKNNGICPHKE